MSRLLVRRANSCLPARLGKLFGEAIRNEWRAISRPSACPAVLSPAVAHSLAVTTLAFDIAELEYWLPLSVGAHVIVASRTDVLSGDSLIRLMEIPPAAQCRASRAAS